MKGYKVSINKKKCISCSACVAICPEIFEIKDDKVIVKKEETTKEGVKEAKESCPTKAIDIRQINIRDPF
ncbi:MAG: ferredoxin [Nanoarchaeota archaeon]